MKRTDAIPYVSFIVDDALSACDAKPDDIKPTDRLVGWQCGFEPLFVAVRSYLQGESSKPMIDDEEAEGIAKDYLLERGWFADPEAQNDPDYLL